MASPAPTTVRVIYRDAILEPCPYLPFSLFGMPCPTGDQVFNTVMGIAIVSIALYLMGFYTKETVRPPPAFVYDPKSEDDQITQRQKWAKKHGYPDIYESFQRVPRLPGQELQSMYDTMKETEFADSVFDERKLRKAASWGVPFGSKVRGITSEIVGPTGVRTEVEEAVLSRALGGHRPREPISNERLETARKEIEKQAAEMARAKKDKEVERAEKELEEAKEKQRKVEEEEKAKETAKKAKTDEEATEAKYAQWGREAAQAKAENPHLAPGHLA